MFMLRKHSYARYALKLVIREIEFLPNVKISLFFGSTKTPFKINECDVHKKNLWFPITSFSVQCTKSCVGANNTHGDEGQFWKKLQHLRYVFIGVILLLHMVKNVLFAGFVVEDLAISANRVLFCWLHNCWTMYRLHPSYVDTDEISMFNISFLICVWCYQVLSLV